MFRGILLSLLCMVSIYGSAKTWDEGVEYARSHIGKPVEQHNFYTFDKDKTTFQDLAGESVMVYFFASWCAPCYETLENLEQARHVESSRHRLIAVSLDEDWDDLQKMLDKTGYKGPVWKSAKAKTVLKNWMFANYGRSLPYILKIDEQGVLTEQSYHIKTVEQWKAVLSQNISLLEASRL